MPGVAHGTGLSAPFNDGDDLALTGGFDITTAGDVTIATIVANGNPGRTFAVNNIATIARALETNVNIADGVTIRLIGGGDIAGTLLVNNPSDLIGSTVGNVSAAVTLTDGILNMGNAGAAVDVAGGTLTEVGTIFTNLTLTGGTVSKFGDVTGALDAGGDGLITGAGGAGNINGAVIINTTNGGMNTIGNAANAVTVTAGNLTMGDATAAGQDVTLTAGSLSVGDVARHLLVNGGSVTQFGTVTGNLTTAAASLVAKGGGAGDVTGVVTINTTNGGMNTIGNAANAVTVTDGNLTMGNATNAAQAVTLTAGTLVMNDASGNILVNGGAATARNIVNAVIANGADLTVSGNIGGTVTGVGTNLFLSGNALQTITGAIGAPWGALHK